MKALVEWMDGESRTYENVDRADSGTDQVLRLYGYEVGGRRPLIAAIPYGNVREWKYLERR